MPLPWLVGRLPASRSSHANSSTQSLWILAVLMWALLARVEAMTPRRIAELRSETSALFYHGFDNYMEIAFPEDELRPISCVPLTRDRDNPRHVELNDVLGNYSLTLIDSLSTLAILASAPADTAGTGAKALRDFQAGVEALVEQYGDGTEGKTGQGLRARGFDVDSKVQVFETVIRGVGGLLSAHLFAAGDLPINGYEPKRAKPGIWRTQKREVHPPILWPNGFRYDGQLLRLALDLAQRLLPAFYTHTGLPYPRVNLRHGIPFYENSPLHQDTEFGECRIQGSGEITETCSAGAGSLVLEFTVLSRLTGDARFEQLAKRAFWAVWDRRSNIGLIGAGVDAEGGNWVAPYAGIGAGADSFFEYALKTYILLSGHDLPNKTISYERKPASWLDPNTIYRPLTDEENSPESFLHAWQDAHAAIKRHLYSNTHHPHYVNVHLTTGSPQAYWIDSLGAYYPGLLTLAGELDEAIETNLLYTALWTRYSALPERWSVRDGTVEGGLGWWPGRPEFIESNYHIYRATRDPWYLHVGEMVLEDIKNRCWTECGWAGLQDVVTGEKSDRMESFFLGETAKYLYLLFDSDHPLNNLDAPYVFTTEGHPLIIPKKAADFQRPQKSRSKKAPSYIAEMDMRTCPTPPSILPLTISATAARSDIFHAASLIGLHRVENIRTGAEGSVDSDPRTSRPGHAGTSNYTFYPWTLPMELVPADGYCTKVPIKPTYSIEFPSNANLPAVAPGFPLVLGPQGIVRLENEGILLKSLQGVKMAMVQEDIPRSSDRGFTVKKTWRIQMIGNVFPLGRDEKVFVEREVMGAMADPSFYRMKNPTMLDIVVQAHHSPDANHTADEERAMDVSDETTMIGQDVPEMTFKGEESILSAKGPAAEKYKTLLSSLLQQVTSALRDPVATLLPQPEIPNSYDYFILPATTPTGIGAAIIPDFEEAPNPTSLASVSKLSWSNIFIAGESCTGKLPDQAVRAHQVIIMRRGGCSFSQKLANIPSFAPNSRGLQLVIIVSDDATGDDLDDDDRGGVDYGLIRPLLDEEQKTPSGLLRHHQVSMVLVGGGDKTIAMFQRAASVGIRRRYHVECQNLLISNMVVV